MASEYLRRPYWAALACGLGFFLITIAYSLEWFVGVDRWVTLTLRAGSADPEAGGSHYPLYIMRDITSIAGLGLAGLLALLTLIYLALRKAWRAIILMLVLLLGSQLSVVLMKHFIDRARPTLVQHGTTEVTASYPSGHATIGAAIALMLAWTAARLHHERRTTAFCWSVGIFVTLLVGFSRLYLGVHWFSDVLAGLCLGAFWACLCMGLGESLQHRGRAIDQALDAPPPRPARGGGVDPVL